MRSAGRGRRIERWRAAQWPLLALAALAAVALGTVGFERHLGALGESRPVTDLLYLALQLFTLESGALRGPLPWQLELARFLAPALAVYTAVQALAVVFRQQLQTLRVRHLRRHVVVCGLGRKGRLLARRYREAGERVVAIERDEDDPGIALCREAGVEVLIGDATEPSLLRRAGVARARQLVAVCGSDGDNAAIAVAARELAMERDGPPLVAVVHLLDSELCALLRERELMQGARGGFRLEFFNVFESGAEAILEEIPWRADPSPHVVLVGLGHFGRTLLRRAVFSRSSAESSLRVTVIDHDAGRLARARAECGSGARCEVETCELDVRSPTFEAAHFALDGAGHPTASGVYVCLDDDGAALAAALALHRRLGGQGIPIAVRMEEESGLATLLHRSGETGADGFGDLRGFGLLERTCRPERLLAVSRETLAQAMHANYVAQQLAAGRTPADNPALAPWARLPEELRESNRAQADDIGRKLASIGCEVRAAITADAEPFAFTGAEIEQLAELEHARFVDERKAVGWKYASGAKDFERRTSPQLVPWSELDEPTREIDRATVRSLSGFLAAIGCEVRRTGDERPAGRSQ